MECFSRKERQSRKPSARRWMDVPETVKVECHLHTLSGKESLWSQVVPQCSALTRGLTTQETLALPSEQRKNCFLNKCQLHPNVDIFMTKRKKKIWSATSLLLCLPSFTERWRFHWMQKLRAQFDSSWSMIGQMTSICKWALSHHSLLYPSLPYEQRSTQFSCSRESASCVAGENLQLVYPVAHCLL